MKNKRITRVVTAVLLLLLLVSVLPLTSTAGAAAAVTPEPPPAQTVEAPTELEAEFPTEAPDKSPESNPESPDQILGKSFILEGEIVEPVKDYLTRGTGSGLNPKGASNATMTLAGRFYIYGIGGDSIKRMTYNGHLYKVFCLTRTKNSGNNVPFTSDINTWGLGSYAADKKDAIGKLIAIANTLYPNPTYSDEFAIQLLIWELAEKTTAGPYSLTKKYEGIFDDVWGFQACTNGNWTPANDELDNLPSARQHFNNVAAAFNATNNAPALPSFARGSQSEALTYDLTYNSTTHKYEITLTDDNSVLSNYTVTCDNQDVTITANGNTVTISATDPDVFNDAVIKTVGNTYEYSYNNNSYIGFIPTEDDSYQTCVTMKDDIRLTFKTGYLKIRASRFSVSLKKTVNASPSVLACIQDNPLYTLQGAVYEIHQGSADGPVVETLTTNANGEATGANKYEIGTKLYAVETVAPSGYLLNTTPVAMTVSSGSNVFSVSDTPTFDPNVLEIKKVGTDTYIRGAVFKAEFFGSNWADSTKLLRTWYFQSDNDGFVKFDEAHLAPGYTSDALFKPFGSAASFPLGCVSVTEIKAANGYLLPQGSNAQVFMFIRQGGGKTIQPGQAAGAYWGNGSANPLNSSNPKGIYTIENDADPAALTAVNTEVYGAPFSLQKTDPSGTPLEGAVFQVDYFNEDWFDQTKLERTWYFKTDSNGYFTLDSAYLADGYASAELFDADKIPVGVMAVREIVAPTGFQVTSFTGAWRIRQTESGSNTVLSYWAASDCWTPTASYDSAVYVLDADPTLLYVKDKPIPGTSIMNKEATDNGSVEGYAFRLFLHQDDATGVSHKTWYGKSDAAGNIYATNSNFHEPQNRVYTFTGMYDGTYAFRELLSLQGAGDVWPESITFSTSGGITPACELTFTGDALYEETNGDCTISGIVLTGLNGGGHLTVTIRNAPIAVPGSITVRKVDQDGNVLPGVTFCLEYSTNNGATWAPVFYRAEDADLAVGGCTSAGLVSGTLVTGADGIAAYTGLWTSTAQAPVRYRLTETATLSGYSLLSAPVYVGNLSPDEAIDLEFTVVNTPTFQLPFTGGGGFGWAALGSLLTALFSLSLAAAFIRRSKTES